jgi:hypothetical protein
MLAPAFSTRHQFVSAWLASVRLCSLFFPAANNTRCFGMSRQRACHSTLRGNKIKELYAAQNTLYIGNVHL